MRHPRGREHSRLSTSEPPFLFPPASYRGWKLAFAFVVILQAAGASRDEYTVSARTCEDGFPSMARGSRPTHPRGPLSACGSPTKRDRQRQGAGGARAAARRERRQGIRAHQCRPTGRCWMCRSCSAAPSSELHLDSNKPSCRTTGLLPGRLPMVGPW